MRKLLSVLLTVILLATPFFGSLSALAEDDTVIVDGAEGETLDDIDDDFEDDDLDDEAEDEDGFDDEDEDEDDFDDEDEDEDDEDENESESEMVTVPDWYEEVDESDHGVTATIWEYPIVEGERASGKPAGESTYKETHDFEDGTCIDCGATETVVEKSDDAKPGTAAADTGNGAGDGTAAGSAAKVIVFITACDVELAKGTPAAEALRLVLAALASGDGVTFPDVSEEVSARLIDLINSDDCTTEELLAVLSDFPIKNMDGVKCRMVTLGYTDAYGDPVDEHYAFSAKDATLVEVYR